MLVIPAIDISQGQCVRLQQGDMNRKTVFGNDPAEVAKRWADCGAEVIYVVDFDGAVGGSSANLKAVKAIVERAGVPVELGGGLRTREDVARVLEMGVQWAIMGTAALENRDELAACLEQSPGRIIVGIDARDGKVAVRGWVETSGVSAIDLARDVANMGVKRVIFTDIATDGMLAGPNLASTRAIAEAASLEVIASGGVTTLDDIRAVRMLEPSGVVGCIVGRALYSGTIDLTEAIALATEF